MINKTDTYTKDTCSHEQYNKKNKTLFLDEKK